MLHFTARDDTTFRSLHGHCSFTKFAVQVMHMGRGNSAPNIETSFLLALNLGSGRRASVLCQFHVPCYSGMCTVLQTIHSIVP